MNEDKPLAKGEPKKDIVDDPVKEKTATHALGATVGATSGAVIGAVAGMAAGPVGSLAGAVGGAVLGGSMGAATGTVGMSTIDTEAHETYWRENYASRPYVAPNAQYDDYAPAYRYGAQSHARSGPREWDEVEPELGSGWDAVKAGSRLGWEDAKHAVRDAWDRMRDAAERVIPGDSDRDGQ